VIFLLLKSAERIKKIS